jgi:6-phosphogluconolactonase
VILRKFDSMDGLAASLSAEVAAALAAGIASRGGASLAVPGGRTPGPFFRVLRDAALDWSAVGVTLTDERWVPEHDPQSNAAQVRRGLVSGNAAGARFHPLHDESFPPADAACRIWESLQVLPRPFDAVVLGMGEDGHFASLFPGDPSLAAALDPHAAPGCVMMQAPTEPRQRISLNLAALLQARRVFLLVTGSAKRALLLDAARSDTLHRWPVSALLAQRQLVTEVYWTP